MSALLLVYWVSAGLGFLYIAGSAAMGHLHGSEDMDEGGDPGDVDGDGDPGDVDGDASADDGGDPGDVNDGSTNQNAIRHLNPSAAGTITKRAGAKPNYSWYFKLLGLFSPTKLTIFLFFFGAAGVVTLHFFPLLGHLTLISSAIIGHFLSRLLLDSLGRFVSGLHSSTNFKQDSLIGSAADLILSIEPGTTGEIIVKTRGSRHSAPARAKNPEQSIKNLSKVIIADYKDGVFLVEPLPEEID